MYCTTCGEGKLEVFASCKKSARPRLDVVIVTCRVEVPMTSKRTMPGSLVLLRPHPLTVVNDILDFQEDVRNVGRI